MTRYQVFRRARRSGYVFWWVFIAAIMVAGGISWFDSAGEDDFGWTAYAPRGGLSNGDIVPLPSDAFDITPGMTFLAFCLLVLAPIPVLLLILMAVAVREYSARKIVWIPALSTP
ncbi:hypothetical protein ACFXHA_30790 [Nocardia sp. NPDC059240]|uniref:hypothetical protein n=1 Tax=Nocardia sp. NPDC059240 TaxID=3346786 RepID=UPI0036B2F73D